MQILKNCPNEAYGELESKFCYCLLVYSIAFIQQQFFFRLLWVVSQKAVRHVYFSALPLGGLPEQNCYCSSLNA